MTHELLTALRTAYGTVSHLKATSGVVAVRNKTALKALRALATEHGATVAPLTSAVNFPGLYTVEQA